MKMKLMLLIIGGLLFTACKNNKIGDTIVEYSTDRSEISIDNFPHGGTGIEGFNTITYPDDFSFQKVDEAIYEFISSKNFDKSHVGIKLRYTGKDQYGKDTVGTWVYIGSIDVKESKKYADFSSWNRTNALFKMFQSPVQRSETKEVPNNRPSMAANIPQTSNDGGYDIESPEQRAERLKAFEPVKGINTTIFNQSDENLQKLKWRVIEDVFFKDHVEAYANATDGLGFKGSIINYKRNVKVYYDVITIIDEIEGEIELYYHSKYSGKSIIRPSNNTFVKIGDKVEGWGTKLVVDNKTYWFLNQAVLKE